MKLSITERSTPQRFPRNPRHFLDKFSLVTTLSCPPSLSEITLGFRVIYGHPGVWSKGITVDGKFSVLELLTSSTD